MKQNKNIDIEISGGLTEDGIVVGNHFDKYSSKNPLVNWMMNGFHSSIDRIVRETQPDTIHEVGCGEGYWTIEYRSKGYSIQGSDFSSKVIEIARQNAKEANIDQDLFRTQSIYELDSFRDSADLIVCCEVLEHLEDPEMALASLSKLDCKDLIFSVPREPLWRSLNMARFKYLNDFGNTPGHVQNWGKNQFVRLVSQFFDVISTENPIPWTVLHCRPKSTT